MQHAAWQCPQPPPPAPVLRAPSSRGRDRHRLCRHAAAAAPGRPLPLRQLLAHLPQPGSRVTLVRVGAAHGAPTGGWLGRLCGGCGAVVGRLRGDHAQKGIAGCSTHLQALPQAQRRSVAAQQQHCSAPKPPALATATLKQCSCHGCGRCGTLSSCCCCLRSPLPLPPFLPPLPLHSRY